MVSMLFYDGYFDMKHHQAHTHTQTLAHLGSFKSWTLSINFSDVNMPDKNVYIIMYAYVFVMLPLSVVCVSACACLCVRSCVCMWMFAWLCLIHDN